MAKIEGFRVRNFKVLKDVTLGRLWNRHEKKPLTGMTAVIGKNGVGKSALFDAFGFLADALKSGVEEACDQRGRGGFEKLRSQGETDPIEFEVHYRENSKTQPIAYEIVIQADKSGRPYVLGENLFQRREGQRGGLPLCFLFLVDGIGAAWKGTQAGRQIEEGMERVELEDRRKLGIATLGALKQHPRISDFRRFIEGWYLSYFTPDAASSLPMAGPQQHPRRQPRQCRAIHGARTSEAFQGYLERNRGEDSRHRPD